MLKEVGGGGKACCVAGMGVCGKIVLCAGARKREGEEKEEGGGLIDLKTVENTALVGFIFFLCR